MSKVASNRQVINADAAKILVLEGRVTVLEDSVTHMQKKLDFLG